MQRQTVTSSSISAVGYDRTAKVVEIEFAGGAVYRYAPVPVYVYRDLLDAPSKGVYVNTVIKPRYKSEGPVKP
jgi:lysyl-tRNA synthetase class 2